MLLQGLRSSVVGILCIFVVVVVVVCLLFAIFVVSCIVVENVFVLNHPVLIYRLSWSC